MRVSIITSLSLCVLAGCVIREVPPSNAPAPAAPAAAAPAAPAAPAAAAPAAAAPAAAAPAPAATGTPAAPAAPGGMAIQKPIRAPEVNKVIAFGGPKADLTTIKGEVFAIPDSTKNLPSFAGLAPFATIYTSSWNVAPRKFTEGFPGIGEKVEWFAIRWEGTVNAKTAGVHVFKIKSDDGARVVIDGQQVVANDGLHPPTESQGQTLLNAGDHQLVVEYFQGPKYEIALQIWVTAPGGAPKILTNKF
ncbi:MAG: hypothetical protein HYV09_22730 [Deltaproteobacteria bacterium]|nr:hypothetical protein [Deltaproteobacteria bacterium]